MLIAIALAFCCVFLLLPLVNVFAQALAKGWAHYWQSLTDPDSVAAIRLTLLVAAISVPLNVVFGLAAAWAIAKFEFRGKSLLITLIDLPFSVSPVVAGLMFVVLFGLQGFFGKWLDGARYQDHLCRAGHRAGDGVHHVPVCGARVDSGDAGDRARSRSRRR